jgi:putative PIN family toxin of toxin-antitoxin system
LTSIAERSERGVPPRRERIPVVLDTNVVIAHYLSRSHRSAARRIFRLWRDLRRLQLVISDEVETEYLEVLGRLHVADVRLRRFGERLRRRETVTRVNLGARPRASSDPDDNVFLATAMAGKASFVITNDPDLLDIPDKEKRRFRFRLVTPSQFLATVEEGH